MITALWKHSLEGLRMRYIMDMKKITIHLMSVLKQ